MLPALASRSCCAHDRQLSGFPTAGTYSRGGLAGGVGNVSWAVATVPAGLRPLRKPSFPLPGLPHAWPEPSLLSRNASAGRCNGARPLVLAPPPPPPPSGHLLLIRKPRMAPSPGQWTRTFIPPAASAPRPWDVGSLAPLCRPPPQPHGTMRLTVRSPAARVAAGPSPRLGVQLTPWLWMNGRHYNLGSDTSGK